MTGLKRLSDTALLAGLQRVVSASQAAAAQVVAHLAEVERRDLHLKAGYSSMFRYVTEGLGFSEGAAYRRIQVARLSRRVPRVLGLIGSGKLHLAGAALLAPAINSTNGRALLEAACGKSKRAIEALVAAQSPRPAVRDLVRRLPAPARERAQVGMPLSVPGLTASGGGETPVEAGVTTAAELGGEPDGDMAPRVTPRGDDSLARLDGGDGRTAMTIGRSLPNSRATGTCEMADHHGVNWQPAAIALDSGPRRTAADYARGAAARPVPLSRDRYKIQFSASPRTVAKLEQARALLSHRLSGGDLDAVFGQALSLLCEKLEKERFAVGARPAGKREKARGSRPQVVKNTAQVTLPGVSGVGADASLVGVSNANVDAAVPGLSGGGANASLLEVSNADVDAALPECGDTNTGVTLRGTKQEAPQLRTAAGASAPSRHIPHAIKRQVFERDGGRCTFVGEDGRRCGERHLITFHHTQPWARQRRHVAAEIVLMCHSHNQLLAREDFGEPLIALARGRRGKVGIGATADDSG